VRRTLGAIALGLGALLLVVGLMAKPVLYTQLATVPLNYKSTSVSVGRDMSVLRLWSDDAKVGHYDKLTGVTVQSTRQVLGIPGRVPADKQSSTAFWQTGVKSIAVGVGDLSYSMETVSFDRLTGVANNCCGDQVSIGDLEKPDAMKNITHEGGYFKFPFDVQKQSYAWWDGDLGKATAAKFVRTEDLFGTETYVFEQRIDKQEVASRTVPAAIFDGTGEDVPAKVMYGNVRTLWVEPNTGVIVKGQEAIDKTLESALGTVAATKGVIGFDESTIKANAQEWGALGSQLGFVKNTLPWLGPLLGVLLGLVGAVLLVGKGRRSAASWSGAAEGPVAGLEGLDPVAETQVMDPTRAELRNQSSL